MDKILDKFRCEDKYSLLQDEVFYVKINAKRGEHVEWLTIKGHIFFVIILLVLIIMALAVIISYIIIKTNKERGTGEEKEHVLQNWRQFWGIFVVYVLATSIIFLFVASFTFGKSITLSDMNNWVGIILGMIALVIGIISLYLSFYNLDEAKKTQNETIKILEGIVKKIDDRLKELPKNTAKEVKFQMFENDRRETGTSKTTVQQETINNDSIESWE